MKNKFFTDERIQNEVAKHGTNTLFILVIGIFADIIVKIFVFHEPFQKYADIFLILLAALTYFLFNLLRNGLIVAAAYDGIHVAPSNEKEQKKLIKTLIKNNLIVSTIISVLNLFFPDNIYIFFPKYYVLNAIVMFIMDFLALSIIGFLIDIIILKYANKKANQI